MSGQGYCDQHPQSGNHQQAYQSNNPYQQDQQPSYQSQQNPWQDQPSSGTPYAPPPGPPPGHASSHDPNQQSTGYSQQQQPGARPRRTGTFEETQFVPEGERGEQREAMEQFEMSKPQSNEDRDLETLQREFPKMDGSLIAALYGDSKSLGATREMLRELEGSGQ